MKKASSAGLIYTITFMISAFLGSRVFALDLGVVVSPVRLVLLLSPFFFFRIPREKVALGKKSEVYKFLLFWIIYSILLIVFVREIGSFIEHLFYLVMALIIAFFASVYLTDEKDYFTILKGFEFSAIIFAIIGVYEIITGDYRFVVEDSLDLYQNTSMALSTIGVRIPISAFGNPNTFGFFLLFAFCVSLSLVRLKKKLSGKALSVVCSIVFFILVIATQSRACFISLLIGLFVLTGLDFHKKKTSVKVFLIITLIASLSYIISWLSANKELYEALMTIDLSGDADGSDRIRMNLISNGMKILSDHYFLGAGLGQIEYYMAQPGMAWTRDITNIHNWWIEILVSSGIVVFVYYVIMYIKKIIFFFKKAMAPNVTETGAVYAKLGASMLSVFLIGAMSASSIFCVEWIWAMFVFWMLLPRIIK